MSISNLYVIPHGNALFRYFSLVLEASRNATEKYSYMLN